jgi:putative transposase
LNVDDTADMAGSTHQSCRRMSGLGNCYDNAKAEAFFSTLKSECLPAKQVFESKAVARRELFEYIETYYNNKRLHSALGYLAPRQFEAEHFKKGSTSIL